MKTSKGRDVIRLTDDDYKTRKFKTAPGGTYNAKISSKSCIKSGQNGNLLNVMVTITKGPHKGVNIFDNIAPHVGWKIAQLLRALGIKKTGDLTLQALLKLIVGKELRVVISEGKYNDKPQNKVTQYLPFGKETAAEEDDDDEEGEEDDEDEDETEDDEDEDEDEEEEEEEEEDNDEEEDAEEDEEDEDEDDEEDEEEEDEDEDVAPKKAKKAKKVVKKAVKKMSKAVRKPASKSKTATKRRK